MKPLLILMLALCCFLGFEHYRLDHNIDPDSRFCDYEIFKLADGSFEIWNTSWLRYKIGDKFKTLEEAKAFRVERCKALRAMRDEKPMGQLIK